MTDIMLGTKKVGELKPSGKLTVCASCGAPKHWHQVVDWDVLVSGTSGQSSQKSIKVSFCHNCSNAMAMSIVRHKKEHGVGLTA